MFAGIPLDRPPCTIAPQAGRNCPFQENAPQTLSFHGMAGGRARAIDPVADLTSQVCSWQLAKVNPSAHVRSAAAGPPRTSARASARDARITPYGASGGRPRVNWKMNRAFLVSWQRGRLVRVRRGCYMLSADSSRTLSCQRRSYAPSSPHSVSVPSRCQG